jgi:hypothetical protein
MFCTSKLKSKKRLGAILLAVLLEVPAVVRGAGWEDTAPGAVEAFEKGDLEAVKETLRLNNYYNYGADMESTPPVKIQALHYAVTSGNVELVKYLASLGWLEECRKWKNYCHPIHSAAGRGRIRVIKYLMSVGFDPGAVGGEWGETGLHSAARHGQYETVKLLCEAGADPTIESRLETGFTPLRIAKAGFGTRSLDPDPRKDARVRANLKKVVDYLESGQCKKK